MIFNALNRASNYVHLQDEKRKKREQLTSVQQKRCGNCYHWMKSSCAPEKQGKKFKSSSDIACGDFELSDIGNLIPKFTQELAEIQGRIDAISM